MRNVSDESRLVRRVGANRRPLRRKIEAAFYCRGWGTNVSVGTSPVACSVLPRLFQIRQLTRLKQDRRRAEFSKRWICITAPGHHAGMAARQ